AIRLSLESVHDRDPDLRRKLAGEAEGAEPGAPMAKHPSGVLAGMQLFGIDRAHPPVASLLLQRFEALPFGYVEQLGRRPGTSGRRLCQLLRLRQRQLAGL